MTEWISVNDHLPEINEIVYVQDVLGNSYIGKIYDPITYKTPYFVNIHNQSITTGVAWMPLPEPYKEGESR